MENHHKILIIGGGLTGLTIAYLLQKNNIKATVLEARDRLGGRIHTFKNKEGTTVELGATWLGQKHFTLHKLLAELNLEVVEQFLSDRAVYDPSTLQKPQIVSLPPNPEPSYRIVGGSSALIQNLAKHLDTGQVLTNITVNAIHLNETAYQIQTNQGILQAGVVISTLPPNLLIKTIDIQPQLPDDIRQVASRTHTWMGESIKVGVIYKKPFWKSQNSSGTIFSQVGPITEMYDHSAEGAALKGFMKNDLYLRTSEERQQQAIAQLKKYYGERAEDFKEYIEVIWRQEVFTYTGYDQEVYPHQNNGHPVYRKALLNDTLWLAGSETAPTYPGYMDGAVQSAYWVAEEILKGLDK